MVAWHAFGKRVSLSVGSCQLDTHMAQAITASVVFILAVKGMSECGSAGDLTHPDRLDLLTFFIAFKDVLGGHAHPRGKA